MRKNKIRSLEATVEILLPVTSFAYNVYKYPNPAAIAKWFIYLTNWKMSFLFCDGIVKISEIRKSATTHQQPLLEDVIAEESPILEVDNSNTLLTPDGVRESRKASFRIVTLNLVVTADLLYWILDRSWDSTYLGIVFHSLDLIVLSLTYVYSDTPVLSNPKLKDRMVRDHATPCLILVTFAIFYGLYQGAGHGTDQVGNPPYAVLDYHGDETTRILTYVYSAVLPFAMPLINGAFLKLIEVAQRKFHPATHEVKALPPIRGNRQTDNFCTRFGDFVSNLLPSCLWSRSNTPPRSEEVKLNSAEASTSRCC